MASVIAADKAAGSTMAVGYDGDDRQVVDTVPDIGADESPVVPVELSGFSAE